MEVAETHTIWTHTDTQWGEDTWRHVYTLWHLSSCCALRACSNILHPSLSLSLSLSFSLSASATSHFLLPLNASHVPRGRAISNILTSLHLLSSPPSLNPLLSFVLLLSSVDIQGHTHPVGCLRRLLLVTGRSIEEGGALFL